MQPESWELVVVCSDMFLETILDEGKKSETCVWRRCCLCLGAVFSWKLMERASSVVSAATGTGGGRLTAVDIAAEALQ